MAISKLVCRIEAAFKKKQYALVIFLDISVAFDSAWHHTIIHNLIKLKCPAAYIPFVASFLCNCQALISVNGELLKQSVKSLLFTRRYTVSISLVGLLDINLPLVAQIQAFADDIVLVTH